MIPRHQQRSHIPQLAQRQVLPNARIPPLRKRRKRFLVPHHLGTTVPPLGDELLRVLEAALQPPDREARRDDRGAARDVSVRDGDSLGRRLAVAA